MFWNSETKPNKIFLVIFKIKVQIIDCDFSLSDIEDDNLKTQFCLFLYSKQL